MPSTAKESTLKRGLPRKTESICPECGKVLETELYDKNGAVYAKKECPEHGVFDSLIWSDTELYLMAEQYAMDGIGLVNEDDPDSGEDNVSIKIGDRDVDLYTTTILCNIDLTNRCNMTCPICFAEANSAGYVYEPEYETIVKMLEMLRDEQPVRCTAVQFSGGEPTIYPRFLDVIRKAKELGFVQIQVASNGLKFRDFEFCKAAAEAGMNTIYLSFDGVSDDVYIQARARKMFHVKKEVLENLRKLEHPPSVVLVPTVVKGVNDNQLGKIMEFAFENSDIVRGVNFQPVAFTGRITASELERGRFTIPDLVRGIGEQTGWTVKSDWYPVPVVAPISNFASILMGENKVTFTVHPHCGIATYLYRADDGKVTPITRFIDVKKFIAGLDELSAKAAKSRFTKLYVSKAVKLLEDCIIEEGLPDGLDRKTVSGLMKALLSDKSKETLSAFSWKMMFIGSMHFQDSYNYDIERVQRCAIHYATPDLKVIPFCAYNSGPEYRADVERRYSVPIDEWKKKHVEEAKALEQALIVPDDQKPDQ